MDIATAIDMEAATAAVKHAEERSDRVQGFLYGTSHVIRDVALPPAEQELWRMTTDDYDAGHSAMMDRIDHIRRERVVMAVLDAASGR